MSIFNEYFGRVYVLSLPSLPARRASIRQQMGTLGIDFEFVDGVDAALHSPGDIVKRFHDLGRRLYESYVLASDFPDFESLQRHIERHSVPRGCVLSPGSLAAGLGHLAIIERMLSRKERNALILEDDILFADDVEKILGDTIRELEGDPLFGDWDMVMFGSCHVVAETTPWKNSPDKRPWRGVRPAFSTDREGCRRQILDSRGRPLRHVFRGAREWWGSHCYGLSARCAARLWSTDILIDPDGLRAQLHAHPGWGLNCYVTHPFLAYQYADTSYIDRVNWRTLRFDRTKLD